MSQIYLRTHSIHYDTETCLTEHRGLEIKRVLFNIISNRSEKLARKNNKDYIIINNILNLICLYDISYLNIANTLKILALKIQLHFENNKKSSVIDFD